MTLFEQTTQVLEWWKLLEALVTHTHSAIGASLVRSCKWTTDLEEAQRWQQETAEMARLLEGTDTMPTLSFPDVRESLARAVKGAVLEAHELRDHANILNLWDEAQAYLNRHALEVPSVAAAVQALHSGGELRGV